MILILGATGMFGGRILSALADQGAPVRGLAHSEKSRAAVERPGVEAVVADLDDPASLPPAMAGVDTMFLVSPMDEHIATRETAAVDAAKNAGVRRIVKLYGAVHHRGDGLDKLHQASIDAVKASGLQWALLSPNSVMETSFLSQAPAIQWTGAMWGCAADGKVGHVALDDVARAGAVVLTDRDEDEANYQITGPAALNLAEVAEIMTDVLGRPIAYKDMPEDEFEQQLMQMKHITAAQAEIGVMAHFRAWKRGDADLVTDTFTELTGKGATSVAQWVAAHADAFAQPKTPAGAPTS